MLALSFMAAGCVATAECDPSSPCIEEGEICFDFECRPLCQTRDMCAADEICVSCEVDESCFGATGRACIEDETQEEEP